MTEDQELAIKYLVERIFHFDFDNLQKMVLEICVEIKTDDSSQKLNPHKELVWEDRFYLFSQFWKLYLDELYAKYLPGHAYNFNWTVEIAPYTLLLISQFEKGQQYDEEIQLHKIKRDIKEGDLLASLNESFKLIGIDINHFSPTLRKIFPTNNLTTYKKLLRLLNFPPLEELGLYLRKSA